jgi:hypothetical protein
MLKKYLFFLFLILAGTWHAVAQVHEEAKPVWTGSSRAIHTQALARKDLLPPSGEFKVVNPRNRGSNKVVPGKGYPKTRDAAIQTKQGEIESKAPILSFDAATSGSTPTDPTGAVGPNHYVNAWNSSFAIYDKEGNILSLPASLRTIGGTFDGEDLGDPIVLYDEFADRFLITQFSDTPNSFLVAVSQGPDPVNDGWYTYRFETGAAFPDYPKFYIWSDGYYITTNKDSNTASTSEVVYVLERDKILLGEEAQHVGFPLPGINTNGFYSPSGFFAVGEELPPRGNAPIVYFQDDAWAGVNEDHLKFWLINMDWQNLQNSTIAESQILGPSEGITPFLATFDGGSFTNLSQPGDAPEVDALQGAIMYMTPYRRFGTHNSVVMNFVVDTDASAAEHAGIRWYELRQNADGQPWYVYQEGTYAPDGSDRWCGSIGIDGFGNIGIGFTVMNDNPENPVFPSLRFTGRYAQDPPGRMTIREETVVEGPSPNPSSRYGDYAHLTIDPVDNVTFWYIGEYFVNAQRRNRVGVFQLEPDDAVDVGIVDIVSPQDATLGASEEVTVVIRNFGLSPQSNIPVEFSIDGGPVISEVFSGTIPRTSEVEFTFSTTVDLSEIGESYDFYVATTLEGDQNPENNAYSEVIENLFPVDVGITSIDAPTTGQSLSVIEEVTVTIQNFGGEPQNNIPVSYSINEGSAVTEVYNGTLEVGEQVSYTFNNGADISVPGAYNFYAETNLEGDADAANDGTEKVIANLSCIPEGSDCSFGDGISHFYLQEIINENIPCGDGYDDFIGYSAQLDRSVGTFTVSVRSRFAEGEDEKFSMWIDLNDNGSFDESELLIDSAVIPTEDEVHSYEFSIPEDANLGEHILRIRAGDTSFSGDLNDPCSVLEYGTTHDYSVVVTDSTIVIDDSILNEAELIISSGDNNVFDIRMITPFEDNLRITVHNLLGQKLVENKIEKSARAYLYELDMSYAATGVYLIRVGTRKVGKVKRIIVQ